MTITVTTETQEIAPGIFATYLKVLGSAADNHITLSIDAALDIWIDGHGEAIDDQTGGSSGYGNAQSYSGGILVEGGAGNEQHLATAGGARRACRAARPVHAREPPAAAD